MKTNDLKKGSVVILDTFGWRAKLLDNQRGTIRVAEVHGIYTECGSVYAHNIKAYIPAKEVPQGVAIADIPDSLFRHDVELTAKQLEVQKMDRMLG